MEEVAKLLLDRLVYEPDTGFFRWLKPGKRIRVGEIAGYIKPGSSSRGGGYRVIRFRVNGKQITIRSHHLVWFLHTGKWPVEEIDHRNNERDDNRFENLREASINQNRTNKIIQSNNRSGFKWVYRCCQSGKWRAEVSYTENGVRKRFRVASIETPDEAYEIASSFAKSAHGTFYNPGKLGSN